ncbi:stage III sporulation protein SpoIIIAB [Bacillaceae bacterium]
MLKLIGALLIVFSTSAAGWQLSRSYADRPKQLRQLQIGLQHLETEIVYGSTPLHQALRRISRRLPGVVGELFCAAAVNLAGRDGASVRECWEDAVNKVWHKTALRQGDKEILLQFGHTLGLTDKEDQQKHVRLAMMNLHSEEEQARTEQRKYEKMCKSLGVLGGILVVILMY